ncbi:MAG: dTMP kinase [Desulfobulbaceae bacterium]|nr:dTMP kinase [Desulfobulbaceae bacterium]
MSDEADQGFLIVFEGTDGTGKSTQLQLLYDALRRKGYPVIATREPTDGQYGQKIRQLYKNREKYSSEEELELFLADRKEHVETLLVPALNRGEIILCDRYFLSTAAYQGAIGFDPETVLARNSFAPEPDLALLFQLPVDIGLSRIISGRGETPDDFEQDENLQKVAAIFTTIDRPYIRKIDASESIESVHQSVMEHVAALFSDSPYPALD